MQKSGSKLRELRALAFMWFGGSLKQRHFTQFGKRQKLGNFRG